MSKFAVLILEVGLKMCEKFVWPEFFFFFQWLAVVNLILAFTNLKGADVVDRFSCLLLKTAKWISLTKQITNIAYYETQIRV